MISRGGAGLEYDVRIGEYLLSHIATLWRALAHIDMRRPGAVLRCYGQPDTHFPLGAITLAGSPLAAVLSGPATVQFFFDSRSGRYAYSKMSLDWMAGEAIDTGNR